MSTRAVGLVMAFAVVIAGACGGDDGDDYAKRRTAMVDECEDGGADRDACSDFIDCLEQDFTEEELIAEDDRQKSGEDPSDEFERAAEACISDLVP